MDWQAFAEKMGYFGLSASVLGGSIAYLIKKLTEQGLRKDLAKYEADLLIITDKSKTQYTILQTKRAEVIAEAYKRINKMHVAMKSLISFWQPAQEVPIDEKTKTAEKIGNDFIDFYSENRIYFDKSTCKLIDDLTKKTQEAWRDFHRRDTVIPEDIKDDPWLKAWNMINDEVQAIREQIEDTFRKILGTEESANGNGQNH